MANKNNKPQSFYYIGFIIINGVMEDCKYVMKECFMVEINAMKKKKDESKSKEGWEIKKAYRPLPGIITTTESGPLRGTTDNSKTKKKGKDSS